MNYFKTRLEITDNFFLYIDSSWKSALPTITEFDLSKTITDRRVDILHDVFAVLAGQVSQANDTVPSLKLDSRYISDGIYIDLKSLNSDFDGWIRIRESEEDHRVAENFDGRDYYCYRDKDNKPIVYAAPIPDGVTSKMYETIKEVMNDIEIQQRIIGEIKKEDSYITIDYTELVNMLILPEGFRKRSRCILQRKQKEFCRQWRVKMTSCCILLHPWHLHVDCGDLKYRD